MSFYHHIIAPLWKIFNIDFNIQIYQYLSLRMIKMIHFSSFNFNLFQNILPIATQTFTLSEIYHPSIKYRPSFRIVVGKRYSPIIREITDFKYVHCFFSVRVTGNFTLNLNLSSKFYKLKQSITVHFSISRVSYTSKTFTRSWSYMAY